ncbi:MAG: Uma2 family endonuclease, partial [Acidimicrobiales bacterium]
TVVLGPPPAALAELIERRRATGADRFDEVWEGVHHMAPAPRSRHAYLVGVVAVALHPYAEAAGLVGSGPFNLGEPDDYRIPDWGFHRDALDAVFLPTAAGVVEILSPDDETYDKLPFYAAHGVDEVMVVDPAERRIRLLVLAGDSYRDAEASALLGVPASDLEAAVRWP